MGVTVVPREIEDKYLCQILEDRQGVLWEMRKWRMLRASERARRTREVEEGRESGTFITFSTSAFRLLPRAFASLAST